MRNQLALGVVAILAIAAVRQETFDTLAKASLAKIEGTTSLEGLRDTVEVIRDSMGVPHIYAKNTDDLFFAQGYVQAQDRLWQMDMYHRTYAGRLAEIMGPSYAGHDRVARLLKYDGPWDEREWTSYHPEGRRIFDAFARGVNAYIANAGDDRLPVEYKLTGLKPLPWTAEASVMRTQTALPAADARAELTLARNVARFGVAEANRRANPSPYRDLAVPTGFDPATIDEDAADGLAMRTGVVRPALLPQYRRMADALPSENRGAQENSPGSNNWVISGALSATGKPVVANDPHRNVANPSIRYIVHLNAPGWNTIGATEAPLPGVAIGHNGRLAWGLTIVGTDQSDVYIEQLDETLTRARFRNAWEPLRTVRDTIPVRDAAPIIVTHLYSRHGPVFHVDSMRRLAYAMRSTMHLPGAAGYVSALRYHALANCREFLDAQKYWLAPTENMICGDVEGNIAWQASAASPKRQNWHGRLPVPGTGEYEWDGLRTDLPRELNPTRGWIATANHDIHPEGFDPPLFFKNGRQDSRYRRLAQVLSSGSKFTLEDMRRLQQDALLPTAAADIALFQGWTSNDARTERLRAMIAAWDGHRTRESAAAALHSELETDSATRLPAGAARNAMLERALVRATESITRTQGGDPAQWRWGRIHRSELPHALVRAYDIRPVERSGGSGTVAATGATYRQIIDLADLDRSIVTNAPGQSGQPGSPYYDNLARAYGVGRYYTLPYTRAAVNAAARHRLLLVPSR